MASPPPATGSDRPTVALLRGVNVGGQSMVAMPKLRAVFESLGCTGVRTYIQSGNVIYRPPARLAASRIEGAVREQLGIESRVVLRTVDELERTLAANPFPEADPSKLHIGFMVSAPPATRVNALDLGRFRPEEAVIKGAELYLYLPHGMGRAKLAPYLGRQLDVPTTMRNWRTVTKLVELAQA